MTKKQKNLIGFIFLVSYQYTTFFEKLFPKNNVTFFSSIRAKNHFYNNVSNLIIQVNHNLIKTCIFYFEVRLDGAAGHLTLIIV